jgi:N-methylhydantoinase A
LAADGEVALASRGGRHCYTRAGTVAVSVYDRAALKPGAALHGPALIDSPTTTVLVPESFAAEVDDRLNLVLRRRAASRREGEASDLRSAVR